MNPLGFNYGNDTTLVPGFAKPSAIIVTGRGNRYFEDFQTARLNGALVYQYQNVLNCPDTIKNPNDQEQYLIDGQRPPLWPYKDANGNHRTNWPGTHLLDIRPGSPWLKKVEQFCRDMIARGHADGFFLDTLGYRPWTQTKTVNGVVIPGADWDQWSPEEQREWGDSCVNIARMIHLIRAELQPDFELIHNNFWKNGKYPTMIEGEKYANGCVFENNQHSAYHADVASHAFAGAPHRKRIFVIAPNRTIADAWIADPNVTHITLVDTSIDPSTGKPKQSYMKLTPPIVPYENENASECEKDLAEAQSEIESLNAQLDEQKKVNADLNGENADLRSRLAQIGAHSSEISKLASV